MRKIHAFTFVSVDGYYAGPHGEIDWFKLIEKDPEYEAYSEAKASSGSGALILGGTTYQMMKGWWPQPAASQADPVMAKTMVESPKIVFSRTLTDAKAEESPSWKSISIEHEITAESIIKLKQESDRDMTILGSGSIVQQIANLGMIDSYKLVVVPVILGKGKLLFSGVRQTGLKLTEARGFNNGIVSLTYETLRS